MLLFWAEQQQVAIPGWLRKDQKVGMHQEGHFASIKQPRFPTTKENEVKRRISCCRGRGVQDGDPSHSPPHPSGDFWSRACECPLKLVGFQIRWRVLVTNPQAENRGQSHDFS